MCDLVFDPTQLNREYLTESAAGLNHSAILSPYNLAYACHSYKGTWLGTIPPLWTFCQQDSSL